MDVNNFKTQLEELDKKIKESSKKYSELICEKEKLISEFRDNDKFKYVIGKYYNYTHKYTQNGMNYEIKGVVKINKIHFREDYAIISISNNNGFVLSIDYHFITDTFKSWHECETIELEEL